VKNLLQVGRPVTTILVAFSCLALSGGGQTKQPDEGPIPLTVPKAVCGSGDHPEPGLQGQVPASLRASGFHGFNCNLS
jgi:hypothetical protein